jgi:HrpA-like RNA helicase
MQATSIPELQRAPLENIILYMKLLNLNDTPKNVLSLAISPPNFKDVEACVWHLKELGALLQTCRGVKSAADGDITFLGKIMGSLPIDIHLAKLVLLGHMFSCLEDTVIMGASSGLCSGSKLTICFSRREHDQKPLRQQLPRQTEVLPEEVAVGGRILQRFHNSAESVQSERSRCFAFGRLK